MKKIFIFGLLLSLFSGCLPLLTNPEFDSNGAAWKDMTMMEWLESPLNTNFKNYLSAIKVCGYDEVVSFNEGYTFIMPDDNTLNTYARMQGESKIENVDPEVLMSILKYLTISEKVISTEFEDGQVRMFETEAGLPMGIHMQHSATEPYKLSINKNLPEQEFAYKVESVVVAVQDIDFKDHIAHGTAKIPSWEWTGEIPNPEPEPEPEPEPTDRILSPVLEVVEYSFSSREVAYVSWTDVTGASGYSATVDGEAVVVENNKIDLSGRTGQIKVSVTAISADPETLGNSNPAEVTVNLYSDFGTGSESDPYRIYSAADWVDIAATINEGETYGGQYLKLMNDVDFKNAVILPAGRSSSIKFCGTLDGDGNTMKNAVINSVKIDDVTQQGAGLFVYADAVIRNLNINGFVVTSYKGKGGILVGQVFKGTIENCTITKSKIQAVNASAESPNDGGGNGGFVSTMDGTESSIINCSIIDSDVSTRGDITGAVVATAKGGTISRCISEKNKVTSTNKTPGGIVGSADKCVIDCCQSRNNVITANNRYLGGVVALLNDATLINCISTDNTCILGESNYRTAGAVVGRVEKGKKAVILNCLSARNYVSSINTGRNDPYIGLLIGGNHEAGTAVHDYIIANCFVASGEVSAAKKTNNSYMGIITGILDTPNMSKCYYNEAIQTTVDVSIVNPYTRYGIGENGDNDNVDIEGVTIPVSEINIAKTSGDDALITLLNNYVNENKGTYPLLKSWKMETGAPTLDL